LEERDFLDFLLFPPVCSTALLEELVTEVFVAGLFILILLAGVIGLAVGACVGEGATFAAHESEKTFPILSKPHLAFLWLS
jgi:hypothetical protein